MSEIAVPTVPVPQPSYARGDAYWWNLIKEIGWCKGADRTELAIALQQRVPEEELVRLEAFAKTKRRTLQGALDAYAEIIGQPHGFWNIGDDSFWDVTAHIVGLGKEEFLKALRDPLLVRDRIHAHDYAENFEYVFHKPSQMHSAGLEPATL